MYRDFPAPIDPATCSIDSPLPLIQTVWPLCERCRYVVSIAYRQQFISDQTTHDNDQSYILYRTTADLKVGFDRDCWICLRAAEKGYGEIYMPILFSITIDFHRLDGQPHTVTHMSIFPQHQDPDYYENPMVLNLELRKPEDDDLPRRLRNKEKQPARNTDDPQTWSYIRDRLEICTASHPKCNTDSSWLPTRLVEVSRPGQGIRLRVILTKELKENRPYISLSHRWGDSLSLRLTKDTYEKYRGEIPSGELPRKYMDAAVAAKRLGVEYLWIDSLCIIQDDPADWDTESAMMYQVYLHAFCNLSATSASSGDEGLFYERGRPLFLPQAVTVETSTSAGRQNRQFLITESGRDYEWLAKLDKEPLNSRAWVFQERLLARRNISFTRDLVYFECAEELATEIDELLPRQSAGFRSGRDSWPGRVFSLRKLADSRDPHDDWRHIVAYYSKCELSKPADKLVAIAGVARAFHARVASDYVAGLWADTISQGLAWERAPDTDRDLAPRDAGYLAPSWSWASLYNTQVGLWRLSGQPGQLELATCEGVTTTPYGTDPFGRIRDGALRLRCFVVPLKPPGERDRAMSRLLKFSGIHEEGGETPLFLNYEKMAVTAVGDFFPPSYVEVRCSLDRVMPPRRMLESGAGPVCYAVPLLTTDPGTMFFLLLEQQSPTEERYRRLGSIVASPVWYNTGDCDRDDGRHLPTTVQSYWSHGVNPTMCRGLARMMEISKGPKDADGKCVITIV